MQCARQATTPSREEEPKDVQAGEVFRLTRGPVRTFRGYDDDEVERRARRAHRFHPLGEERAAAAGVREGPRVEVNRVQATEWTKPANYPRYSKNSFGVVQGSFLSPELDGPTSGSAEDTLGRSQEWRRYFGKYS